MSEYIVSDVKAEHVMGVAKFAAALDMSCSTKRFTRKDIEEALSISTELSRRATSVAVQLKFVNPLTQNEMQFMGKSELRYAARDQLPIFFRERLQDYPPFLVFLVFLSQGYNHVQAVSLARSIFNIQASKYLIGKTFRQWGIYAGLLELIDGQLSATFKPFDIMDFAIVKRLEAALETDLRTKAFVINELGTEVVSDLYQKGLPFMALPDGLQKFEYQPKDVLGPVGSLFESFISSIQPTSPLSSQTTPTSTKHPLSYIVPIADSLLNQKAILKTHKNLAYGVAGFRNAASHGPDPDTGLHWQISPHASLVGILLTIITMRSIHQY
ncbi:unnamed protein product, partial [marine sediment metagenome]